MLSYAVYMNFLNILAWYCHMKCPNVLYCHICGVMEPPHNQFKIIFCHKYMTYLVLRSLITMWCNVSVI